MLDVLRNRAITRPRLTGTSALALSTIINNLMRIVSTVCLTRLLSPDVYGVTGMIMSVFYMINMVSDIGLQAYVVRHERSTEPDFLSSVYTIHAIRGVILATIAALLAWPLSLALAKPEIALPLMVASLVFVIDGQVSLHQFCALRDGRVPRVTLIDMAMTFCQIVSAIVLAYFLRNVWAIVGSMIVASLGRLWAGYALFPGSRHQFLRDREIAADLWRFSRVIAASSTLTLILTQVDKLAMARILSLAEFGTYVIASSLAGAPQVFAFNYSSSIVYPTVAAAWRDGRSVAAAYYGCWGRFFYLYAFGGGALIGVAGLLIRILYDPRYLPAALYLSLLAVSTSFIMVNRSMESVQIATGHQKVTIEFNIVRLAWLISGGLFALAKSSSMILVLTIGLIEVPVYAVSLFRMARDHEVRWLREASFGATLAAGFAAGTTVTVVARMLFPTL